MEHTPKKNADKVKKLDNGKYECLLCGGTYKPFGIDTHIWRKHTDAGLEFTKNHDPNKGYIDGTRVAWNKGLTKDDSSKLSKSR